MPSNNQLQRQVDNLVSLLEEKNHSSKSILKKHKKFVAAQGSTSDDDSSSSSSDSDSSSATTNNRNKKNSVRRARAKNKNDDSSSDEDDQSASLSLLSVFPLTNSTKRKPLQPLTVVELLLGKIDRKGGVGGAPAVGAREWRVPEQGKRIYRGLPQAYLQKLFPPNFDVSRLPTDQGGNLKLFTAEDAAAVVAQFHSGEFSYVSTPFYHDTINATQGTALTEEEEENTPGATGGYEYDDIPRDVRDSVRIVVCGECNDRNVFYEDEDENVCPSCDYDNKTNKNVVITSFDNSGKDGKALMSGAMTVESYEKCEETYPRRAKYFPPWKCSCSGCFKDPKNRLINTNGGEQEMLFCPACKRFCPGVLKEDIAHRRVKTFNYLGLNHKMNKIKAEVKNGDDEEDHNNNQRVNQDAAVAGKNKKKNENKKEKVVVEKKKKNTKEKSDGKENNQQQQGKAPRNGIPKGGVKKMLERQKLQQQVMMAHQDDDTTDGDEKKNKKKHQGRDEYEEYDD